MPHERDDARTNEAQADETPNDQTPNDGEHAEQARPNETQPSEVEDDEDQAREALSDETEANEPPAGEDPADEAAAAGEQADDEQADASDSDSDSDSDIFAVDAAGEVVEVEAVETELFTVGADGEIIEIAEVTETVEVVEREERPTNDDATDAEPDSAADEREASDDDTVVERERAWRMPAETAPQERIWMAFPPGGGNYLGESDEELTDARTAWTEVAHSILRFEPVTMVVDPHDIGVARRFLSTEVDLVVAPLDDAWMRDIGPTFVLDDDGRLGAVTWRFNGWGGQEWANWENDSVIGANVATRTGATRVVSGLVNEGGGIHVDGCGTVLLTETVQLDPGRNPGRSKADVEAELARTLGTTNPIWLKRGLHRDAQTYGTRGHVDILATFPSPGRVLVHSQQDASHPDHAVSREILATLRDARTPDGSEWDVIELPAPQVLRDDIGFVDYSYVNHLVVNGGVIACTFADPNDEPAQDILAEAYDGREIVGVDARALFARGGGIHCITQQQPRAASAC